MMILTMEGPPGLNIASMPFLLPNLDIKTYLFIFYITRAKRTNSGEMERRQDMDKEWEGGKIKENEAMQEKGRLASEGGEACGMLIMVTSYIGVRHKPQAKIGPRTRQE